MPPAVKDIKSSARRRPLGRTGFDKPELYSMPKQLRGVGHPQFQHDRRTMCFDRSHTDLKTVPDVAVHVAGPDQLQNLRLTRGNVAKGSDRGEWRGAVFSTRSTDFGV
jgi:hypothetical protein